MRAQKVKGKRYAALDGIRGFALLNMIAYHAIWDLVYIFGVDWSWYKSRGAYVWQQGICWTFILVSGFCLSLGKHARRRGAVVFAGGALISGVTIAFMPQDRVVFGILTLIGSCMLLVSILDGLLQRVSPLAGMCISMILFLLTGNVNNGFLGFESINIVRLPGWLYRNRFTTWLGFPQRGFYSTDYFSLFPWIFLFLAGYFLHKKMRADNRLDILEKGRLTGLEWLGRHSFEIYMLHQPVLYLGLGIFF
ncbi:MAG: DUF1624 domain-containing protein [Roseburia sp.]|nr:DUF1624 domain-containing protein [Roseburia sp.]